MKPIWYAMIISLLCGWAGGLFAEEITLTTYYPSPRGAYEELRTTNNAYLATQAGNVVIGTATPNLGPSPSGTKLSAGNLDVNDVYLRSSGGWVSHMARVFLTVPKTCRMTCNGGVGEGGDLDCMKNSALAFVDRYNWPVCPSGWHAANTELGDATWSHYCINSDANQDASDDRPDSQLWVICTPDTPSKLPISGPRPIPGEIQGTAVAKFAVHCDNVGPAYDTQMWYTCNKPPGPNVATCTAVPRLAICGIVFDEGYQKELNNPPVVCPAGYSLEQASAPWISDPTLPASYRDYVIEYTFNCVGK